jgi:chaperonin GroES
VQGQAIVIGTVDLSFVLFRKYGPSEVKVDGKDYLITKESDILAVIE